MLLPLKRVHAESPIPVYQNLSKPCSLPGQSLPPKTLVQVSVYKASNPQSINGLGFRV